MINHSIGIQEIVKKRISSGANYLEVLRTTYGADPREVWEVYKKFNLEKAHSKFKYSNLYPNLPEPHPAYSQWRITPSPKKIILSKLLKKNYSKICFLGCPVLGNEYSKLSKKETYLLDIDKKVLSESKNSKTIFYNVNDSVPSELKNSFECVVCDPPWYDDDIKLFIKRSAELLKVGGTIYISLPSLLTKPSIIQERLNLQDWLTKSKLIISEMIPLVEYEVPPFEFMAYKDIPDFTGEIWRRGDWVKLKKCENAKIDAKKISFNPWIEYSFGKRRIFLKEKNFNFEYEKPQLISLVKDNILNSVSKRNPLIPKIDIWTSRNKVYQIKSGYNVIKVILENLTEEESTILKILSERFSINNKIIIHDCLDSIKKLKLFL